MSARGFFRAIVALLMIIPAVVSVVFGGMYVESVSGRLETYMWFCGGYLLWFSWACTKIMCQEDLKETK